MICHAIQVMYCRVSVSKHLVQVDGLGGGALAQQVPTQTLGLGVPDGLLVAGLGNLDGNMVVAWVRAPEIGTT